MRKSLYIPFNNFKINKINGQKILYENLVQSGPAYKLVVHESPSWLEIKDIMPRSDMIEIISNSKAKEYKRRVERFFKLISENVSTYKGNGQEYPIENLTSDVRRTLAYLQIAYDYKATIYEDDMLGDVLSKPYVSTKLMNTNSDTNKEIFSQEIIKRVQFIERLMLGYRTDRLDTISINQDPTIFYDLMNLLDNDEVKLLSETHFNFGVFKIQKDLLKREIKEKTTHIIQNKWLPYLVRGTTLALSYVYSRVDLQPILDLVADLGTNILNLYDFREYAPPIQDPDLLKFSKNAGVFSYEPFYHEYQILIPKKTETKTFHQKMDNVA